MRAYTLLQLVQVALFAGVVVFGALTHSTPLVLIGAGFLIGISVQHILAPEGGTVVRRSLIGYALGALFVVAGVVAARALG